MRGHLVPLVVVLIVLAAPGASAMVDVAEPATPATDSGQIRWLAPPAGFVDHPMHVAVGVYDGDRLVRDQSLRVTVVSGEGGNQELVFFSQSVHEHDGFHTIVLTPREAGVLSLRADFTHPVGASETIVKVPIHASRPSDLVPYEPFRVEPTFQGDPSQGPLTLVGKHYGIEHQALLDLHDADGRLLTSHWPLPASGYSSQLGTPIGGLGSGQLHALVTSHRASDVTIFTETLKLDLDRPHQPIVRQPQVLTYGETCEDAGIALTTDPSPIALDGLTWHTDTDIRVAVATNAHQGEGFRPTERGRLSPSTALYQLSGYDLWAQHTGTEGNHMTATAADPFRELTLRIRDPGLYTLAITDRLFDEDAPRCSLYFRVVPNPATAPGRIEHELDVGEDGVRVELRSVRDDGNPLWRYAFDTRVVKLHSNEDPGRLVWKGKLHGIEHRVGFTLGQLEPGDYEVRTYPSPQDLGTPPVAAPSEDGFVYRFQIEASPEAESPDATPSAGGTETIPGPAALWVALVATAALLARKDRRLQ